MFDHLELIALIQHIQTVCDNVKLVVVDSLAFPFKSSQDLAKRSRIIHSMAQLMRKLASLHDVAIVITNHMTSKQNAQGKSIMVPALGDFK